MKLKHSIPALVAALALTACSDFLEPQSESEFVPEDATSLNELLLGEAYQRNDSDDEFTIFLSLLDDDVEASPYQTPLSGFDGNLYLASFTWQPDMYQMMEKAGGGKANIYKNYYKLILGTNAVIDYLPKVKDTQDNINKVKAQAYALRGFYYFNLVNIFGQPYNANPDAPGVVLKLQSGIEPDPDFLKRKSVAQVYEQILDDLHTAEETYMELPENEHWSDNYRTSLPMVQLMLSRTYLYMENWERAAEYAKLVMDNKQFKLLDLNNVPIESTDDTGNPVRNYYVFPTYKCSETIWPYGNIEDMFKWTYNGANTENTDNNNEKMYAYFQASQELLGTYVDYDLRIRRYITQAPVGNLKTKNGEDSLMYMAYGKVNIGTPYYLPKRDDTSVFGRCLRLSEAYLNYAEAMAMRGEEFADDATSALNTLREKRFDPEDFEAEEFDSQEELVQFIRDERRRELCFEGHRWFDLRRWGMPSFTHKWHHSKESTSTYRLEEGDLLYTVPIPDEALQSNGELVQNELPGKRTPIE